MFYTALDSRMLKTHFHALLLGSGSMQGNAQTLLRAAAVAVCPRFLAVLQTPSLRASRKILLHVPVGMSVSCRNTSVVKRSILFGSLSSINVFRVNPLDCKASKWFVHPMPLKNCSNVCSGSASAVHLLAACTAMHSCHSARDWHENHESNKSRITAQSCA